MKYFLALATLGLLSGCGYSYETYRADYMDAWCTTLDECGALATWKISMEDCLDYSTDTGGGEFTCEDYDSKAAEACVEETAALTCENYTTAPTVCGTVCSNFVP